MPACCVTTSPTPKNAGFDFLRIHIKIDDPLLLHYADTMGILLMLDFP